MAGNSHIIRKLIIEIGLPTREEAFDIQTKFSNEYKQLILKIIEEIFDRLVGKDEVMQIDKLEIDLGEISRGQISFEVPQKVKVEMEEALTKLVYEVRNSENGSADVKIKTSAGTVVSVEANISQQSRSNFETLLHFLEFGVLPWSKDQKEKPTLRNLVADAMENHPEELRRALQQLSDKKYVFKRLAQQIPENQAQYLSAILGCSFSSQLNEFSEQLKMWMEEFFHQNKKQLKSGKTVDVNSLKQQIQEQTLYYFSVKDGNENFSASVKEVSDAVTRYLFFILEQLFSFYKVEPDVKSVKIVKGNFNDAVKIALKQFVKKKEAEEKETREKKKKRDGEIAKEILAKQKKDALKKTEERLKAEQLKREVEELLETEEQLPETPEAEDGIYIANAGLVIVAPYLPTFFGKLGLTKDRKFVDDEAKSKAVHLLQWMVDGGEQIEEEKTEHDLVLNKIICGMDIAEPVAVSIELSDAEKEEASGLLNSVIANWTIIKRSTIPSLRITFLKKEGKLKRQGKDWHLFIQRDSAVDILIDRIPWSISIIRFSWSKETIYTEW